MSREEKRRKRTNKKKIDFRLLRSTGCSEKKWKG
jgi:hypothetical protein